MRKLFTSGRSRAPRGSVAACGKVCAVECTEPCALSRLPTGVRAVVVQLLCPQADAGRLRILGLFEGTAVTIVDDRAGVVLDVRGTRVAIGMALAAAIIGLPLS